MILDLLLILVGILALWWLCMFMTHKWKGENFLDAALLGVWDMIETILFLCGKK